MIRNEEVGPLLPETEHTQKLRYGRPLDKVAGFRPKSLTRFS